MRLLIEKDGVKLEYEDSAIGDSTDYVQGLISKLFFDDTAISAISSITPPIKLTNQQPVKTVKLQAQPSPQIPPDGYKIKYIDGLRYLVDSNQKKAHSPDANEPLVVEGSLFTGRINNKGEYIWSKSAKREHIEQEISADEVEELRRLAAGEPPLEVSEVFDESSAFDDLENLNDDACELSADNLTVSVVFKGIKYAKTFKTEAVAIRQHESITDYIKSDPVTLEQLLIGNATQYKRV